MTSSDQTKDERIRCSHCRNYGDIPMGSPKECQHPAQPEPAGCPHFEDRRIPLQWPKLPRRRRYSRAINNYQPAWYRGG